MEREDGADLWRKAPQLRAACIFNTVLLNLVCLMWSSWLYGDHKRVARFKKIIIKSLNRGLPWWSSGQDCAPTAGRTGLLPGGGTNILHAVWRRHNIKKKKKS